MWTAAELFTRNIGTKEDQDTAFPPHKIIGNLYYVGTRSLGTFLIVTPQGNILINSDYERTVPVIKASVEKLGFKFTDIKILLGSHAHGDHMEGDALAQELSGAQVMAMAEDIPALQTMRTPSGKARPNYKVIHDGEKVTLGGTTLVAHLTPGHTRGCTTWTASIEDGGRSYDVVIIGSVGVNAGTQAGQQSAGAADRRGVSAQFPHSAGAQVRCAAGVASGDVQFSREVSEAGEGSESVYRSTGVQDGAGYSGDGVQCCAGGAEESRE